MLEKADEWVVYRWGVYRRVVRTTGVEWDKWRNNTASEGMKQQATLIARGLTAQQAELMERLANDE